MNHYTHEQHKRQLEMWSDKHPIISGCVTIMVLPVYGIIIMAGLVAVICQNTWQSFPHWVREVFTFVTILVAVCLALYCALYAGLWTMGELLAK